MKLLVDIGNTAIKWAVLKSDQITPQQSQLYKHDNFKTILTTIWLQIDVPIESVWISNVAGPNMEQWITKNWQCQIHFIRSTDKECGVINAYHNPEQLGVDRWLALIAAYDLFKFKSICIVDCGTAITIDVLSANGKHQGGLIIPGINTMQESLLNNTYALKQLNVELASENKNILLAHDTHRGIKLGSLYAAIGLIEYVINNLEPIKLIITGGDAPVLMSVLKRPYKYIPDLVLQGLRVIVNQRL
jgi:type III pantothenate kinase